MSWAELIRSDRAVRPSVGPLSRRPLLVRFVSSTMSSLVQRWAIGSRMVRQTTRETWSDESRTAAASISTSAAAAVTALGQASVAID